MTTRQSLMTLQGVLDPVENALREEGMEIADYNPRHLLAAIGRGQYNGRTRIKDALLEEIPVRGVVYFNNLRNAALAFVRTASSASPLHLQEFFELLKEEGSPLTESELVDLVCQARKLALDKHDGPISITEISIGNGSLIRWHSGMPPDQETEGGDIYPCSQTKIYRSANTWALEFFGAAYKVRGRMRRAK